MKARTLLGLLALTIPLPRAAAAGDSFGHHGQVGLRGGLVDGYNMIFRYDHSPFCIAHDERPDNEQQKFCGHAAPLAFDFAMSYGLLDSVEPYVFFRLGLESEAETRTLPLAALGAGTRLYTMKDSAFKIFVEPALAWEFESGSGSSNSYSSYKKDLLIHLAAGPQLDLARYAGLYVDAGLTTGIFRAIHSELELQLGVQARFP